MSLKEKKVLIAGGGNPEAIAKPAPTAMNGVKKQNLPTKVCRHCLRPFVWRKKWARDWENVRYCSDACRRKKSANST